jgi:hypothetical protein
VIDFTTTECLLFPDMFGKRAVLQFDQRQGSSDGGAILLKGAERSYGLVSNLAGCLQDNRQAGKVDHSLPQLLAQRVFSIACGYPDGNDSARLGADPVHKMLLDRDPVSGLENGVGAQGLYRMGESLALSVLERHRKRLRGKARLVTIDVDPTDDATHGAQQMTFFNGHYDNWCYLPVLGFVSFNDEAEQYLCAAVLRPGNVTAHAGAVGILRRLLVMIRSLFPAARIRVRLDGGFAHPDLLDFLDAEAKLDYVVAMANNQVLERKAEHAMQYARAIAAVTGETEHVYDDAYYAARSWSQQRRIIIKAEVVRRQDKEPKDNPRFVITNMKQSPQWLYEKVYCQRGDIENRIKELHALHIGRTSCSRFWANQFRVLLTASAYVLMQELRLRAAGTHCARAQVWTLRERLLKLGARVVVSARRMVLHLPASFPFLDDFRKVAIAVGASTP